MSSEFEAVRGFFEQAAEHMQLDPALRETLARPAREGTVAGSGFSLRTASSTTMREARSRGGYGSTRMCPLTRCVASPR